MSFNSRLFFYSLGSIGLNTLHFFLVAQIFHFYDDKQGSPTVPFYWVGIIFIIGRIWDAVSDPLIGAWSDRTQHPWGRRKIFLIISLPLLLLSFFLLWFPPYQGVLRWENTLYLLIISLLFFTAFTGYGIPYDASMAELSRDPSKRLKASGFKSGFALLGIIGASIVISSFEISQAALLLTIFSGATLILTLIGIRDIKPRKVLKNEKKGLQAILLLLKKVAVDKGFIFFCLIILFAEAAGTIFITNIEYFIDHILLPATISHSAIEILPEELTLLSDQYQLYLYLSFILAMVAGIFTWSFLSRKREKSQVLLISLIYLTLSLPLLALPKELTQAVILFAVTGFGYGGLNLLIFAIVADFSDLNGKNKDSGEASYFGIYAFTRKTGFALGLGVLTILIEGTGALGLQEWVFRLPGPVMALFAGLAAIFLILYRNRYIPSGSPS